VAIGNFIEYAPYIELFWRPYIFQAPAGASLQIGWLDGLNPIANAHADLPEMGSVIAIWGRLAKQTGRRAENLMYFLMGRSNSRVHPVILMAAIFYLESRISGECTNCKPITNTDVVKTIRSLEKKDTREYFDRR